MSTVHVTSEIGRLRQVLVHAPGAEVDRMVPSMMEELLFDDILFGDRARDEHRHLHEVLRRLGVEVLDAQTLLEETLEIELARNWVLAPILDVTSPPVRERLRRAPASELAAMLVHGVRVDAGQAWLESGELFEIAPLPNWCFQRDPQAIVGDRVLIAAMATSARWREAVLNSTIFRFHPRLSAATLGLDPFVTDGNRAIHLGPSRPHFEGGDLLMISKNVVALGHSQRTNRTGVQQVARALARRENGPRWLVVLTLPNRRAFMHLDTVITPIDRDACLVFTPIFKASAHDTVRTFEIDLHSDALRPSERPDFLAALRARGVDLQPIPCGGDDPMEQQRDQWTDGANALAVAPGVVLMYDRNVATAAELNRNGFRILQSSALLNGGEGVDIDAGRTCILLPSHELSRARGGPHCLTYPLVRDDVG